MPDSLLRPHSSCAAETKTTYPFPKLQPPHPVFIRQHNLQTHQLLLLREWINHDRRAVDCTSRDLLEMHLRLARLFLSRTGLSSTGSLSGRLYGWAKTANLESAENFYVSIKHNIQRPLRQRRWFSTGGAADWITLCTHP
jgi:hypothetical protein